MHRAAALVATIVFFMLTPACGDGPGGVGGAGGGGGTKSHTGSIVVGVLSDLRLGIDFHAMHVVMKVGSKVVRDEIQAYGETLHIPAELPFDNLPDGTPIRVELEALLAAGATWVTLVSRVAESNIVGGKRLLMRVALDSSCVKTIGSTASQCAESETCVAAQCVDPYVDPAVLAPYAPGWDDVSHDPCKPGGGTPTVTVGEGQGDYLPMMDGDTAQVEAGPQGGHHIWVAVRMKNLAQSGSITSVTGHFPDLGIDVGPFDVIFTFEPDEGGYCKLYGLRFQLDQNTDIAPLLGHPLDVKVEITDPAGTVGDGTRKVVLSTDFLQ